MLKRRGGIIKGDLLVWGKGKMLLLLLLKRGGNFQRKKKEAKQCCQHRSTRWAEKGNQLDSGGVGLTAGAVNSVRILESIFLRGGQLKGGHRLREQARGVVNDSDRRGG